MQHRVLRVVRFSVNATSDVTGGGAWKHDERKKKKCEAVGERFLYLPAEAARATTQR
jgi:hypothetical protein